MEEDAGRLLSLDEPQVYYGLFYQLEVKQEYYESFWYLRIKYVKNSMVQCSPQVDSLSASNVVKNGLKMI